MDAALIHFIDTVTGLPAVLLYLIIVVWLVLESMAVPIPNEAILLFSGFLVSSGHLNFWIAWVASIVGTLVGASLAWWIARTYGPAGVRRVGRYVFLTESRLATAHAFFERRGAPTIFLARLTPVVRTVVSYPAGLAAMPYRPFVLATLAGCAIWNAAMLLLGRAAGDHWQDLFRHYHTPALLVGAAVIVGVVAVLVLEHQFSRRLRGPTQRV